MHSLKYSIIFVYFLLANSMMEATKKLDVHDDDSIDGSTTTTTDGKSVAVINDGAIMIPNTGALTDKQLDTLIKNSIPMPLDRRVPLQSSSSSRAIRRNSDDPTKLLYISEETLMD